MKAVAGESVTPQCLSNSFSKRVSVCTGDTSATSIAQAIGEGFGNAVAVAIGNSVDNGLRDASATGTVVFLFP